MPGSSAGRLARAAEPVAVLCEQIWRLENELGLLDWDIGGVKPWQYMRARIYLLVGRSLGVFDDIVTTLPSAGLMGRAPSLISRALLSAVTRPRPEALILAGGAHDRYLDPVASMLERENVPYLRLAVTSVRTAPSTSAGPSPGAGYLSHRLRRRAFGLRRKILKSDLRVRAGEVREMAANICSRLGVDVDLYRLFIDGIAVFREQNALYRSLLWLARPKKLFLVNSYGQAPAIKAAKDLGVEVIELQHGVISRYHLGYSFPGRTRPLDYFPDRFYSWGAYWTDTVDLPIDSDCVEDFGFPYFRERRDRYRAVVRDPDQVVVLSGVKIAERLAETLITHVQTNAGLRFSYRLHPSESRSALGPHQRRLLASPNVQLAEQHADLYRQLAGSGSAIGVSSTAIFEAAALGCHPVLVDLPGIEHMGPLISTYGIPVLRPDDDLRTLLAEASRREIPADELF